MGWELSSWSKGGQLRRGFKGWDKSLSLESICSRMSWRTWRVCCMIGRWKVNYCHLVYRGSVGSPVRLISGRHCEKCLEDLRILCNWFLGCQMVHLGEKKMNSPTVSWSVSWILSPWKDMDVSVNTFICSNEMFSDLNTECILKYKCCV